MTKKARSEEYAVRKPRCDNSPVQVFFSAHVCPTTFSFSQPPCIHSSGGCARQINEFFSGSITGASAKLLSSPCARIYFHTTKLPNRRYISTRSLFFTILLNEYVQFSCQCEICPRGMVFFIIVVWHLSCCNMHMWPSSMIDTARLFSAACGPSSVCEF